MCDIVTSKKTRLFNKQQTCWKNGTIIAKWPLLLIIFSIYEYFGGYYIHLFYSFFINACLKCKSIMINKFIESKMHTILKFIRHIVLHYPCSFFWRKIIHVLWLTVLFSHFVSMQMRKCILRENPYKNDGGDACEFYMTSEIVGESQLV